MKTELTKRRRGRIYKKLAEKFIIGESNYGMCYELKNELGGTYCNARLAYYPHEHGNPFLETSLFVFAPISGSVIFEDNWNYNSFYSHNSKRGNKLRATILLFAYEMTKK